METNTQTQKFLKYLILHGVSNKSLKYYKSDLLHFLNTVGDKKVTRDVISDYINSQRLITPVSTINRRLSTLRSYSNFLGKDFMSGVTNQSGIRKAVKTWQDAVLTKFERKPKFQNILRKIFFSRPNWYKKYHSYALATYIHIAILVLFTSISGYALYDQIFNQANNSLAFPSALTRPNRFLSFQGRLTDNLGNPKTVATNMVFKLYSVSSGGSELWNSGTCSITPDQDGVFSTLLGSSCGAEITSDVFSENASIWLGATMGADTEATPRVQIATVAYALNAETVQGYPTGTGTSTIPYINSTGNLVLANASPKIQSTSGTFAVEGQALSITTPSASDGVITVSPDGVGTLDLTFAGAAPGLSQNGFVNATDANITSGSLYSGTVASNASGYNFVDYLSGSSPTSKFKVDYAGNTTLASGATLTIGGTSLNETTSPTDSGAYLVGANDEFANSNSTNVQAVLNDLDAAITGSSSPKWNAITNPDGNMSIANAAYTTTFGYTSTGNLDAWINNFNNNSTSSTTQNAFTINNAVVGSFTDTATENLILLQQLDTTAAGTTVLTNALKIDSAANSGITNGINITNSAGNITTGINITDTAGGTLATGISLSGTFTTGIDAGNSIITNIGNAGTDFDTNGGLALADDIAVNGGDITTSAGTFNVANAATTLNLGSTNITRAINIGTGTGVDTIHIGDGATGADVITIGSTNAGAVSVKSNAALNLTGSTNSLIDFPNFDVATTGSVTIAAGQSYTGAGAVTLSAGGTATDLTLDAATSGVVNIGNNSTGDVLLAGGSGGTGCTVTNSNGNLTCTGTISGGTILASALKWNAITDPDGNLALAMGANTTTLTYNGTTGAGVNLFNLTDTASNTGTGYLMNLTTAASSALKPLHVSAAGVEALTVDNTGKVGIGTTGPDSSLEVSGSGNQQIKITSTDHNASSLVLERSVAGYTSYQFKANSGNLYIQNSTDQGSSWSDNLTILDTTGFVGIGTPTPSAKLHVYETSSNVGLVVGNSGNYDSSITLNEDPDINTYGFRLKYNGSTDNRFTIESGTTSLTEKLAILRDTGAVGIGTPGPDAKLDVLSSTEQLRLTYTDGSVYSSNTVDSSGNLTIDNTGTKTIVADDLQVNGGDILDSNGNENIRFGTTASAVDEATLTNAAANGIVTFAATGGDTDIALSIDSKGADSLNLNGTATGDVNLAGGFGGTGCTVTNSNGNLSCNGTISGTFSGTIPWSELDNPTGALTLAMGTNATTFGWTPTAGLDAFTMNVVNNGGSATTQNGLVINNAVAGSFTDTTTENLLLIQQLDTTTAGTTVVTNGIKIDSAGSSAMTNGMTITNSAGNLTTGITIADTAGGTLATGIAITGTVTNAMDAGNFPIVNIGNAATDFNANGGLTLAENLTIQGTTGLTFATGVGGDITFANAEKIDNDVDGTIAITATTTSVSGNLKVVGNQILNSAGTATVLFSATPTTTSNTLSAGNWMVDNSANVGLAALIVNNQKSGDLITASVSGTTKMSVNPTGDINLGYSGTSMPATTNPLMIYNHGTTNVASIDTAGHLTLADDLTINGGNITNAFTADSTVTVTGTLTANGTFAANGIVTLGDGGDLITVSGSDVNFAVIDGSTINLDGDGSPTADLFEIGNGDTSATSGVDGLLIDLAMNNASGDSLHITPLYTGGATNGLTYNTFEIDAYTATNAAGTDTVNGIKIGNLTESGGLTSTAINIGTGYDADINATTSLETAIGGTNETTLTSSAFSPATTDSNALGTTALMWSDLFLADTAVINFNNGGITATYSSGNDDLTFASGDYNFDLADTRTVNIDGDGSPTADLLQIGAGDTSATSSVDGLFINLAMNNAGGDSIRITPSYTGGATDALTYNIIEADAFTATNAAGTDTVNGIKIGALTESGAGVVTSTAINIATGWDTILSGTSAATATDVLSITAASLTTGSGLVMSGPTGATAGATDALLKLSSDIGNIGTSNGLISSTAVFDATTATGVNLYLTSTDAIAAANTDYGIYNTISNTGALNAASSKTIYGSYTSVSGTGATTNASVITNVYGGYITTTATHATNNGTVNQYGLYVGNGTSSTNGTSTKTGLYIEAPTGADTNYAAIFAGGNTGLNITAPVDYLDVKNSNTSTTLTGQTAYGGIHLTPSGTDNSFVGITFGGNGSTTLSQAGILARSDSGSGADLRFGTTDNYGTGMQTRMIITTAGLAGIGTTSPSTYLDGTTGLAVYGTNSGLSWANASGHWTSLMRTGTTDLVFYNGSADRFTINSSGRFFNSASAASDYGGFVQNVGNSSTYLGLATVSGTNSGTGTNVAAGFFSGDGSILEGQITFTSGTVTYGAFTANHDTSIPDEFNQSGYPYGTLLCLDSAHGGSSDSNERQIVYQSSACKTGSYSTKILGAYAGKYDNKPNLHQVYVLGDGQILVNGENGDIKVGDQLTTSSTTGIGMKAVAYGNTFGIAQEDYHFTSQSETKLIAVQYGLGYHIPDLALNETGEATINGTTVADYSVSTEDGVVTRVGAFAKATVAKLVAGIGSFRQVETNLISPVANADLIIDLQPDNNAAPSKLAIKGANDQEVASIDANGRITSEELIVNNDATVSGTLYADKIESSRLTEIESMLNDVETNQQLLTSSQNWNTNTATNSGVLTASTLETTDLYVTHQAAISSLFVSDNLTTKNLNSLDTTLSIQSLASAPLEIMAGKIKIDTDGNAVFSGNVEVLGNLQVDGSFVVASDAANASPSGEIVAGVIDSNATAGKATLDANTTEIKIKNAKVDSNTLIYVTPVTSTQNKVLYVKSKADGEFTVGFTEGIDTAVEFNWWIIKLQ